MKLSESLQNLIKDEVEKILTTAIHEAVPEMTAEIEVLTAKLHRMTESCEYWKEASEFWAREASELVKWKDEQIRLATKEPDAMPDGPLRSSVIIGTPESRFQPTTEIVKLQSPPKSGVDKPNKSE